MFRLTLLDYIGYIGIPDRRTVDRRRAHQRRVVGAQDPHKNTQPPEPPKPPEPPEQQGRQYDFLLPHRHVVVGTVAVDAVDAVAVWSSLGGGEGEGGEGGKWRQ